MIPPWCRRAGRVACPWTPPGRGRLSQLRSASGVTLVSSVPASTWWDNADRRVAVCCSRSSSGRRRTRRRARIDRGGAGGRDLPGHLRRWELRHRPTRLETGRCSLLICARLRMRIPRLAYLGATGSSPMSPPRLPVVSCDGLTWRFGLCTGFRFSDGSPVRRAFAQAIHRAWHPGQLPGLRVRRAIVGAEDVQAGRRRRAPGCRRDSTRSPSASRGGARVRRLDDDAVLLRRPADASAQPGGVRTFRVPAPYHIHGVPTGPAGRPPAATASTAARASTTSTASTSTSARLADEMIERSQPARPTGYTLVGRHFSSGTVWSQVRRRTHGSGSSSTRASPSRCPSSTRPSPLPRQPEAATGRQLRPRPGTSSGRVAGSRTDQYHPGLVTGHQNHMIYSLGTRPGAGARPGSPAVAWVLYVTDVPARRLLKDPSSWKIGLEIESGVRGARELGVPGPARRGRRAVGSRARALDAGLRRSTGYINQALDAQVAGGTNSGSLRRPDVPRPDAAGGAPAGHRAREAYRELDLGLARDAAPLVRSTFSGSDARLGAGQRVLRPRPRAHDGLPHGLIAVRLLRTRRSWHAVARPPVRARMRGDLPRQLRRAARPLFGHSTRRSRSSRESWALLDTVCAHG